jgi:hypothetical protein
VTSSNSLMVDSEISTVQSGITPCLAVVYAELLVVSILIGPKAASLTPHYNS